jgi:hypothetical protein
MAKSKHPVPTADRLRDILSYCPETGIFRWLVDANSNASVMAGDIAGGVNNCGYRRIGVDGLRYAAADLAWLYMTGEWPQCTVDHRNRIRGDNRWDNLRAATRSQNLWNMTIRGNNTSGHKGVSWVPSRNKWIATICVYGKLKNLGRFEKIEDAIEARRRAAEAMHGDFATDGRPYLDQQLTD